MDRKSIHIKNNEALPSKSKHPRLNVGLGERVGNGGGEGQAYEGRARFLKNSQLHDFVSLESKLLL